MRRAFGYLIGLILAFGASLALAANVTGTRIWPSPEYSRITIEMSALAPHTHFTLRNPDRLVLDLEGVEPNVALNEIATRVSPQDEYIAAIRVARNRPGVTRVVVELKTPVRPQVFTLQPMGELGHRVVMDLYPASMAAIERQVEQAIAQAGVPRAPSTPAKPGSRASAKPEYARLITIAIDAGHGGADPGAIGAGGTREKDVTLSISRRLKAMIDQQENMRAVLTRDGDYFVALHERVNRARRAQADLFVSVHADAWITPDARGSSVFALSERGATSAAARWLAKRENDADLLGGVNLAARDRHLKETLIDLSQTQQIADSLVVGSKVLEALGGVNRLHKPRVEQAGFAVLKAPDIPSILIETAFISNPDEEKRLNDEAYQEKKASAIVNGIKRYFEQNPPLARDRAARNL